MTPTTLTKRTDTARLKDEQYLERLSAAINLRRQGYYPEALKVARDLVKMRPEECQRLAYVRADRHVHRRLAGRARLLRQRLAVARGARDRIDAREPVSGHGARVRAVAYAVRQVRGSDAVLGGRAG